MLHRAQQWYCPAVCNMSETTKQTPHNFWENEISRDFSWRWVKEGYPIKQQSHVICKLIFLFHSHSALVIYVTAVRQRIYGSNTYGNSQTKDWAPGHCWNHPLLNIENVSYMRNNIQIYSVNLMKFHWEFGLNAVTSISGCHGICFSSFKNIGAMNLSKLLQ